MTAPTPDPRPPGPGPDPRPPTSDAGPDAAPAGPESAADLVGARRTHPDRARRLRGALGHLRRAAGRHRGERARARRRSRPPSCRRWPPPASRCPSSSCTRRSRAGCGGPFVDEQRRKPEGPPAAVRGRRAADLHALHRRLERARARRAARALARGRDAPSPRCSPRQRGQRPAASRRFSACARTPRTEQQARRRPGAPRRRPRRRVTASRPRATCHASDGNIPAPATVSRAAPRGVPERVTFNGQQRTTSTPLRPDDGARSTPT